MGLVPSLTISNFEIFLILKIRVYTISLAFVYWGVFTVDIDTYPNLALRWHPTVLVYRNIVDLG